MTSIFFFFMKYEIWISAMCYSFWAPVLKWRMEGEGVLRPDPSFRMRHRPLLKSLHPPLQRVRETRERQGQAKLLWVLQYLAEGFRTDASRREQINTLRLSSSYALNFWSSLEEVGFLFVAWCLGMLLKKITLKGIGIKTARLHAYFTNRSVSARFHAD